MLSECHDNNADGSGYSYTANGSIYIRKGFFTFDELKRVYWHNLLINPKLKLCFILG